MSLRHVSRLWVKVIQGLIINPKDHRSTTSNASMKPAVAATTRSISNSDSNSNTDFIPNSNSDSDYDNMQNVVEKESSSSRSKEEKLRLTREAEKADIIVQLICFGPNS